MVASGGLAFLDLTIFQHRKKESHDEENRSGRTTTAARCPQCHLPVTIFHHNDLHLSAQTDTTQQGMQDDKESPIWPVRWIMILDLLMALVLLWTWCAELGVSTDYYSGNTVLMAYATVPALIAFILHCQCFWKAFREREKQRWKKEEEEQRSKAAEASIQTNTHSMRASQCTPLLGPDPKQGEAVIASIIPGHTAAACRCSNCSHFHHQVHSHNHTNVKPVRYDGTSTLVPLEEEEVDDDDENNILPQSQLHCKSNPSATRADNSKMDSANTAETDLVALDVPALPLLTPSESHRTELSIDSGDRELSSEEAHDTIGSARFGSARNAQDEDEDEDGDASVMVVKKKGKRKIARVS